MIVFLTRKSDNATIPVEIFEIDYFNPNLFESEIHFKNGTKVMVREDEKDLRKIFRKALQETGGTGNELK